MCWLHGHVVCDGSVIVGILGGGWLGEWVGGWSGRSHTSDQCAHSYLTCAFQSRGVWGCGLPQVDLGNPAGGW